MQNHKPIALYPPYQKGGEKMWQLQYYNRPEFICSFEDEQDYVDAMFILIIFQNFGILLRHDMLMQV